MMSNLFYSEEFGLHVFGRQASFTIPAKIVERESYHYPTYSVVRALFESVFMHNFDLNQNGGKNEHKINWEVTRLQVLNKPRFYNIVSLEIVKGKKTQRNTECIYKPEYYVFAKLVGHNKADIFKYSKMVEKRLSYNQRYKSLSFGKEEYLADYDLDFSKQPVNINDRFVSFYDFLYPNMFEFYNLPQSKKINDYAKNISSQRVIPIFYKGFVITNGELKFPNPREMYLNKLNEISKL